ncbi:uncharacterized protein LOC6574311 [Drosophila mojavensis]|uniref:uncharacterized protein LOC6574311 n=1 Tax=Drosophila mojavensis TaxID=7230 RepID=UPI001CD18C5E|nr:uncharacterized protein LOC6574311 [Drosophila mojavensis]
MVKPNKQSRPMPATDRSSTNASGSGNYMENTYCVVLHVVEAINFYGREMREGEREQIIMNAALNTVDFEVEGTPSATSETIIFNSNCIWECDMAGIKRIKTDHRPVKVTFFACGGIERKTIGSLLLPVRGLPVLGTGGNNSPLQLKMFWHKLICISNEFRSHKPEVLLMLAIIKKSLLHTKDFKHLTAFNTSEKQSRTPPLQSPGHSITANMLQSQANVYVQSLVQLGLLQVGNDPLVDCDIIEVVLQFKQLKNVRKFVRSVYQGKLDDVETVLLMFDFVGNVTNIELKLNHADIYTLNDVLGLRFKSSLRSIRLYFQRIFYLPINMYVNGSSIANYRMDFGKLLPPDNYFADNRKYVHSGCFAFDRFSRMGSAREVKPIMDFTFTVDIQEVYWRQQEKLEEPPLSQQQLHEDSLDMQSVGAKAVILEVPKDRVFDNGVDWTRNSEMQSVSGNGSVDSLNVGAELSESDGRETPLESVQDSDVASTVHSSQGRRRKFIRLIDKPVQYDNEEEAEDHHYDPKLVTRKLPTRSNHKDNQFRDDLVDLDDDVGSDSYVGNESYEGADDWLAGHVHDSKKTKPKPKHKHSSSTASGLEKTPSNAAKDEKLRGLHGDSAKKRSILELQRIDEEATRFLQEEMLLREQMPKRKGKQHSDNNIQNYTIDDSIIDDSWAELEQEYEKSLSKQATKQNIKHNLEGELMTNSSPRAASKTRKSQTQAARVEAVDLNTSFLDTTLPEMIDDHSKKYSHINSTDDSFDNKPKVIRRKKIVSKTEHLEVLDTSTSTSRLRGNKYMSSQENLEAVGSDSARQKLKHILRDKVGKKPENVILDIHMPTETEEEWLQKPNAHKSKPMPNSEEKCKSSESVLPKKIPKPNSRLTTSKADLSLSARWVEVSKEQARALEETEQFIADSCKADLDVFSVEEQCSQSSKKPKKKKLGRTSHSIIRKNMEYSEMNVSSEMEASIDSSLMNESFKEHMPEPKVSAKECSNVHSSQDIIVSEMNLKIETSAESSFVEQLKLERKVIKKNNDCDKSQDPITNPGTNHIANQSTPNTSKLRGRIRHKTENVASELESSPTRKYEKKPRQTVHRSALHKYLDAEEACAMDQSQEVGDQSEKPLKKRTVKATDVEHWEAESLEVESKGRKGLSKKRTAKVSSDVNHLQQTVIGKLCALKEKNSAPAQLGAAAPVSRLEVTVHMYDETKVAEERARDGTTLVNQSVNTDITNMNESIKLILATGRKLQNEMQRKTQEYMDSLSMYRSEGDSSQQTSNDETAKSIPNMTNISADYESKFVELEQHIGELEQHLRKFESRTQDMQEMNSKLEKEKIQLKQRINKMELQIEQLRQQGSSGNNLQEVLSEMRLQNVRYMDMCKAKDRYKKQWRRSAKHVHALKLAMYEKRMESEKTLPQMLNLKNILTKDADEFEREFGRFRRSTTALSFSGSGDSPEPLLKDYLRGLSSQTVDQHKPVNHVDSSRMH